MIKKDKSIGKSEQVQTILKELASQIGDGVYDLNFAITLEDINRTLTLNDFNLLVSDSKENNERKDSKETKETNDDRKVVFCGCWREVDIKWEFIQKDDSFFVKLEASSQHELNIISIDSLILKYYPDKANIMDWRVVLNSADIVSKPLGFPKLKEALEAKSDCSLLTGIFPNNKNNGLFLATKLPQNNVHKYKIGWAEDSGIEFTCTSHFIPTLTSSKNLCSEITWICGNKNVIDAFKTYSNNYPNISENPMPLKGWNSWDYYYFTVSLDCIIETMEDIRIDPQLSKHIQYIVLDDGWQYLYGEWQPNYKFPGGLENITKQINDRGFIPGIWTGPILVSPMSKIALRNPEILVKDEYGDPLNLGGTLLIDPTTPGGIEFLRELYTRLYQAGFRLFKVDYVSILLNAERFYDKTKGVYEVLRDLFSLIRECVTRDSHIMGCSLPPECGPNIADSGRTGIDIHNQWSHVEWAMECFTFSYWMNNKIWINDLDFLVVRGYDTSLETQTNVVNHAENNPNPTRWRSGPVFNKEEARTWTNILLLSGGNMFLSDRLRMLNEDGKELIYKGIEMMNGVAATPLDLCCEYHASLWLQAHQGEYRLTIINWSDSIKLGAIDFKEYNIDIPKEVTNLWTDEKHVINEGKFNYKLGKHESVVLTWENS